jgi:hypothetical protein
MTASIPPGAVGALRAFARARPPVERCELCGLELGEAHDHLLDPKTRQVTCACAACSRVLGDAGGTRWALVRHRVRRLGEVDLTDAQWQALGLPIDLAFFVRSSAVGRPVALYPSAGGLVESGLDLAAWDGLVAAHPALGRLEPDVEAVLVRRVRGRRDVYLASIDACYRLVGLMRTHWRGFSGGPDVQAHIEAFFAALDRPEGAS